MNGGPTYLRRHASFIKPPLINLQRATQPPACENKTTNHSRRRQTNFKQLRSFLSRFLVIFSLLLNTFFSSSFLEVLESASHESRHFSSPSLVSKVTVLIAALFLNNSSCSISLCLFASTVSSFPPIFSTLIR